MLTIGKFAEAGKVGVETIRFYQRRGLLRVPDDSEGQRKYTETDLQRLHFIRSAQTAGFKLEEIRELIALDSTKERRRAFELAHSKVEELDAKIEELQNSRNSLKWLADECKAGAKGPCPILAAFGSKP